LRKPAAAAARLGEAKPGHDLYRWWARSSRDNAEVLAIMTALLPAAGHPGRADGPHPDRRVFVPNRKDHSRIVMLT
jgi:hypothetical protein